MKKRKLYPNSPFKFHKYAVSRKRNASKEIVERITCKLRRRFGVYKRLMNEDNLEALVPLRLTKERKEALNDIYSYKSQAFRELRYILTTDNRNRQSNVCPCCLLDIVGTLDHIIPQTPFPEFSTNPYNLVPCCFTCNSKKNDDWRKNGIRTIIDFYIDDIPDIQFLYVQMSVVNNLLEINFFLDFPIGYDVVLKSRIKEHYRKLNLLARYKENVDDVIDKLQIDISTHVDNGLDEDIIKTVIKSKANGYQRKFGINYWKALLMHNCADDNIIFDYLKNM